MINTLFCLFLVLRVIACDNLVILQSTVGFVWGLVKLEVWTLVKVLLSGCVVRDASSGRVGPRLFLVARPGRFLGLVLFQHYDIIELWCIALGQKHLITLNS